MKSMLRYAFAIPQRIEERLVFNNGARSRQVERVIQLVLFLGIEEAACAECRVAMIIRCLAVELIGAVLRYDVVIGQPVGSTAWR